MKMLQKKLFVRNNGNTLFIKLKDCNYCKTNTLKAKVYSKSLSGIKVSGASAFTSKHVFNETNLSITTSGVSKVSIAEEIKKMDINISGASKIILNGNAFKHTIQASGASSIRYVSKPKTINQDTSSASSIREN